MTMESLESLLKVSVFVSFGTLVTLVIFVFRVGFFVASTNLGIKDAKENSVRAHIRIDKIEDRL